MLYFPTVTFRNVPVLVENTRHWEFLCARIAHWITLGASLILKGLNDEWICRIR
jgi:hypothetical protein